MSKIDTQVKLIYNGKIVGKITTNRSLTIDEACQLVGIDLDEMDGSGNDPAWDYGLFQLEY